MSFLSSSGCLKPKLAFNIVFDRRQLCPERRTFVRSTAPSTVAIDRTLGAALSAGSTSLSPSNKLAGHNHYHSHIPLVKRMLARVSKCVRSTYRVNVRHFGHGIIPLKYGRTGKSNRPHLVMEGGSTEHKYATREANAFAKMFGGVAVDGFYTCSYHKSMSWTKYPHQVDVHNATESKATTRPQGRGRGAFPSSLYRLGQHNISGVHQRRQSFTDTTKGFHSLPMPHP